jgi:hypothetical protein
MTPLLRVIVVAVFMALPGTNGFNVFGFRESAPPSVSSLAFPKQVYEEIPFDYFSDLQENYAQLERYLRSLETKPSCHRIATALISDCKKVDTFEGGSGGLRFQYAAQLAACEFEAMGIDYPEECKSLGTPNNRHSRCIHMLSKSPQWWTTLSNNVQNAMMICGSVRQEIEQGKCGCCVVSLD